jgi:hypothetical protein
MASLSGGGWRRGFFEILSQAAEKNSFIMLGTIKKCISPIANNIFAGTFQPEGVVASPRSWRRVEDEKAHDSFTSSGVLLEGH